MFSGRFNAPRFNPMQISLARSGLWFLLLLPFGNVRADPAADAVAAVLKLRSQPGYSWEVSTTKPGTAFPAPARTKRGAMTATGEMILDQTWPDGRTIETITRRNGAAVARTSEGWKTKNELSALSRTARRGSPDASLLRLTLSAFDSGTPEEELTRLLNDAKDYVKTGDKIEAVLTDRGASYWLGSNRLIPGATGKVQLRLRDGLIRECRINATGERNGNGGDSTPLAFECVMTFAYSTPPAIPLEAKLKLDESSAR
jgi:hypothetical protein